MVQQALDLFPHERKMDDRIRRIEINGKMYFSVLDVFQHYGNSSNPTMAWKTALARLKKQGFKSSKEILELQFEGQGQRETPVATFRTMFRIAQVTDFQEWEEIRDWMAGLANERIEEFANPETIAPNAEERERQAWRLKGKSEHWINERMQGVQRRNTITETEKTFHLAHKPKFAALTGRTYKELFGRTKRQIVEDAGMTPAQAANFRDNLNALALQAIGSAELTAALKMEQLGRLLTDDEQMEIIIEAARMFAPVFRQAAGMVGIDLATGKPLITAGRK